MKASKKFKAIGFTMLALAIFLIILGTVIFPDTSGFGSNPNIALFVPGALLGVLSLPVIAIGFLPKMLAFSAKLIQESQEENSETFERLATKNAEINAKSIETTARSIGKGLRSEETIFCKECGESIEKVSKFCMYCGSSVLK